MSSHHCLRRQAAWIACLAMLAFATPAQQAPVQSGGRGADGEGAMPGMDHGAMQGMDHASMQGTHHGAMAGMDQASMPDMERAPVRRAVLHASPPAAPAPARDPDVSGIDYVPMHGAGMGMDDNAPVGMLLVDQLEAFDGRHGSGQQWDIEGHYGNDYDKLWLRTEGERSGGRRADVGVEALWSHAVAPFWDTRLGVRADAGDGPHRQWLAFGLQGLAPYWFELEGTAYLGPSGRMAARVRAGFELLFTQRLVLRPQLEATAYGRADPARHLGSGLSDASLALRLRYEIRRPLAPYVGVVWTRRFSGTATFAREEGRGRFDRQWVAGVRFWF